MEQLAGVPMHSFQEQPALTQVPLLLLVSQAGCVPLQVPFQVHAPLQVFAVTKVEQAIGVPVHPGLKVQPESAQVAEV